MKHKKPKFLSECGCNGTSRFVKPRRARNIPKKSGKKQPDKKFRIRELYAPSLVGKYEIVLKIDSSFHVKEPQNSLRDTLYMLGPKSHQLTLESITDYDRATSRYVLMWRITEVRLVNESDLFMVMLANKEMISRIYRIRQPVLVDSNLID